MIESMSTSLAFLSATRNGLDGSIDSIDDQSGLSSVSSNCLIHPLSSTTVDPHRVHIYRPCPYNIEWIPTNEPNSSHLFLIGIMIETNIDANFPSKVMVYSRVRLESFYRFDGDEFLEKRGVGFKVWRMLHRGIDHIVSPIGKNDTIKAFGGGKILQGVICVWIS